MFKIITLLILTISLNAVVLDKEYINKEYNALTDNQKDIIIKSFKQGNLLTINNETYGYTIATYVLVESSCLYKVGDSGNSVGLTHISLERARSLLSKHPIYNELSKATDYKLKQYLMIDELAIELTMLNFKLHYERWKSYRSAVVSHNGYNPYKGFYNSFYYERFVNLMQVVKRVIEKDMF